MVRLFVAGLSASGPGFNSQASSGGVFIRSQYHSTDATFIYYWRYVKLLVASLNIATKNNK